jgi:hypothetical protein
MTDTETTRYWHYLFDPYINAGLIAANNEMAHISNCLDAHI